MQFSLGRQRRTLLVSLEAYEDYTSPTLSKAYLRAICPTVDAAKFTENIRRREATWMSRKIALNKEEGGEKASHDEEDAAEQKRKIKRSKADVPRTERKIFISSSREKQNVSTFIL